jgi:hypothetical protein
VGDWPLGSSTKDSWVGAGHSCFPPSATAMVQASPPTAQDDTTNGDNVVPASPAFCAERLGRFFDMIKKKRTSPLFKAPIRLAVQPTPSDTPKHSNSRFANNKLLRFRSPVATKSYSCDAFAWRLVSSIGLQRRLVKWLCRQDNTFPLRKANGSKPRDSDSSYIYRSA